MTASGHRVTHEVAAYLEKTALVQPDYAALDEAGSAAQLTRLRSIPPRHGGDEPVLSATDTVVGAGGVAVRIYQPLHRKDGSVLVFAHGGGWVTGSLDTFDGLCRRLTSQAGCTLISVGYRLAPEHPFPAGLDDCYEVTCWAAGHARLLGGDGRVGVAGSSAGGNLVAAVAIRARDTGGPRLACQALLYPVLDAGLDSGSCRDLGTGYGLTRAQLAWFWRLYAPPGVDRYAALCSPGRVASAAGLPPTLVLVPEFDPLRDEGEAFGARLRAAGVETIVRRWPGQIHGFLSLTDQFSDALAAVDQTAHDIVGLLAPSAMSEGRGESREFLESPRDPRGSTS